MASGFALAQTSTYVSPVDADLTISRWTTYPLVDNLDGIYARPLQTHLKSLMEDDTQFRWVNAADGFKNAPEEFEEKPKLAQDFQKKSKVDAFIAGRIAKGPQGISIRLALIEGAQGIPLAIESKTEIKSFETEDLKKDLEQVYTQLKNKIPYQGTILSRRESIVTINLGQKSGLRPGQEVEALQIIQIQRHPRFGFLVNVEKEIMGKVRITKVDQALSFGTVTSERSEGLLKPGFKVGQENFVKYNEPGKTKDGKFVSEVTQHPDSEMAFGNNPQEWKPLDPPTFGKVALLLGFGDYSISNSLNSGVTASSHSEMLTSPSFHVEGELWLSAAWFMGLELHQYVATVDNGLPGSQPSTLNLQTLETQLVGGYNVLSTEEFYGPKLQLMFGLGQMDSKVEGSSPTAYTSMKYGGPIFGIAGSIPLAGETSLPISVGGKFTYNWHPTMDEAPVSSGSSTNSISIFTLFSEYQRTERIAYRGELSFHQYDSAFSTSGRANSASQGMTTLAGGVVFLF